MTRQELCKLTASASLLDLPGVWKGNSYRHHPVGIIRGHIMFQNDWNVNDYCSIYFLTDPSGGMNRWCKNPAQYGDPVPHPIKGEQIKVYDDGKWLIDGPWIQAAENLYKELLLEISTRKQEIEDQEKAKKALAKANRESKESDLRKLAEQVL